MNDSDSDKQQLESPPEPPPATPDVLEEAGGTEPEPPAAEPDVIIKAEDRIRKK